MQKVVENKNNESEEPRPHVVVIHHYMWPDESPTSRLFSDLAFHLARCGFRVSVFSARERYILRLSDLTCRERNGGVEFYRVRGGGGFRKDASSRLLAGFLLLLKWFFLSFRVSRADLVILGTDPPFSVWLGALMKISNRTRKLLLWTMDIYPDAIVSEGLANENHFRTRVARAVNNYALSKCDGVVDLGACMRQRIPSKGASFVKETITPWSPYESGSHERDDDVEKIRAEIFSDAKIGLIYSGALGRAHDVSLFIRLTMELAAFGNTISTVIASHGPNFVKIKSNIHSQKIPIKCLEFEPGESYLYRLKAADFHLVSVKSEWTGVVVPSKFFAALAVGRPVIAAVDEKNSLASLCRDYDVGWVLNKNNIDLVKEGLKKIALRPEKLRAWQKHVLEVYKKYFSKSVGLKKWSGLLK